MGIRAEDGKQWNVDMIEQIGWTWTGEGIYPFFYRNDSSSWLFFHGKGKSTFLRLPICEVWGQVPLDESEKNTSCSEEEVDEEERSLQQVGRADPVLDVKNWWSLQSMV